MFFVFCVFVCLLVCVCLGVCRPKHPRRFLVAALQFRIKALSNITTVLLVPSRSSRYILAYRVGCTVGYNSY